MKKLLILIALVLLSTTVQSQEKLYLLFEFMKVDNNQEQDYWETEEFWEKIHEQRVANGDILGWDLWGLQPGGEQQGFQYITVSLYNDPVKMMSNPGNFEATLKAAYPEMSEIDRNTKLENSVKSRDLAVRVYLEQIASTNDDFKMPLGTVAGINLMKATQGNYEAYEKNELEIFLPMHQKEVDEGNMGNWGLLRYMLRVGSDVYATHITVDMFHDYNQFFKGLETGWPALSEDQSQKIQKALDTRDLKFKYMGTLLKKVRK